MNKDDLVIRMYNLVKDYLVQEDDQKHFTLIYNWETKNKARIKRIIRSALYDMLASVDNFPLSPQDWQTVSIGKDILGKDIFVETPNPELECEVG